MTNEALSKFIAHLATVAPEVWRGMTAFHRAEALTALALDVLGAIVMIVASRAGVRLFMIGLKRDRLVAEHNVRCSFDR